jgi:hypothetical protein
MHSSSSVLRPCKGTGECTTVCAVQAWLTMVLNIMQVYVCFATVCGTNSAATRATHYTARDMLVQAQRMHTSLRLLPL